ncbi:ADP-ribosylglycohydrolase family protein [Pararhizobium sp. BT-229]|uniref:ADP-ribosylglycohydrolase family protein n=1 Tax=Pararhizobium sp. BT-229 TaxID=2986923 RepID=UPI0021F70C06|nr:ADP-ribosylglycohydrolase family protein [Pararhizobium sp. BT-229]MCV9964907.1 ADP-ribosylglycohydrolase family protein [Pararhizobium sp. BT-229]
MFGAFCGDVLGAPYEVNTVTFKNFILLADNSKFTDDTVCTIAVAKSILDGTFDFADSLRRWGRHFQAPYGNLFEAWIWSDAPSNNSAGNGSVSRVAAIPWLANSLEQTLEWAAASAMTSHRHPSSVDAACAATAAAWLAMEGWPKDRVREAIEAAIGYDLTTPLDDIRPDYGFRLLASETAPVAIRAVLEGEDFEDVMRLAISMGGDADTIAAVAGGIAEVYHPIPHDMQEHVFRRLPQEARELLVEFNARRRTISPPRPPTAQEFNAAVEAILSKTRRCREAIEAGPVTFRSRCRRVFSRIRSIPAMLKAV